LSSAFKLLEAKAKGDAAWDIFNFALGDAEAKQEINIAENSCCSSLLNILPSHEKYVPKSKYIGTEIINVRTLDSIFFNLCKPVNRVYLKIDTQGFENKVIKGAEKSLGQIDTIQMEMSLVPLYENELLFNDMYSLMTEKGYSLIAIETGFSDQATGQMLKVDGIFRRL
jgi:FkbM family methyltransferase